MRDHKCGSLSSAFCHSEKFNNGDMQALTLAYKIGHKRRRILREMVALGLKDSEIPALSSM